MEREKHLKKKKRNRSKKRWQKKERRRTKKKICSSGKTRDIFFCRLPSVIRTNERTNQRTNVRSRFSTGRKIFLRYAREKKGCIPSPFLFFVFPFFFFIFFFFFLLFLFFLSFRRTSEARTRESCSKGNNVDYGR